MTTGLFDPGARARWTGTRALAVRPALCPHCLGAIVRVSYTQLPLLRGGGYGEALTIDHDSCRCTARIARISATNPRGKKTPPTP